MERTEFFKLSLEEKRNFLIGFLQNFTGKSEELTTLYNYFTSTNYIDDEECNETFTSLKNTFEF